MSLLWWPAARSAVKYSGRIPSLMAFHCTVHSEISPNRASASCHSQSFPLALIAAVQILVSCCTVFSAISDAPMAITKVNLVKCALGRLGHQGQRKPHLPPFAQALAEAVPVMVFCCI